MHPTEDPMAQWESQRSVTSMRLTAEMAVAHGLALADCLAGTGVRARALVDPDVTVSGHQELQLIRNVLSRLDGQPALGLKAGARYHFTAYGALGFAIISSRTARSAIDVALQHFNLTFAFVRFELSDTARETRVRIDGDEVPRDIAGFVVERAAAALVTNLRDMYGSAPVTLHGLQLQAPRPAQTAEHETFFGLQPQFGCTHNIVMLDRRELERPLAQANEPARQLAIEQCRKLIEARKVRSGTAHLVRGRLVTASAQMPTMNQVADDLCMTVRTLRRRLLDEGTGFAELRDEVRRTLADELLHRQRLSVAQIAERLGYAETASFIGAFRRWHGTTPHASRRRAGSPR
jgi:AraC-like DNA-binding protein